MRFILRELERDDQSKSSFFNSPSSHSNNNDDESSQSSSLSIHDQNQLIKNEEDYQIEVFEKKMKERMMRW